jgi:hypothetical protein
MRGVVHYTHWSTSVMLKSNVNECSIFLELKKAAHLKEMAFLGAG